MVPEIVWLYYTLYFKAFICSLNDIFICPLSIANYGPNKKKEVNWFDRTLGWTVQSLLI